jgi:hypothetical protein
VGLAAVEMCSSGKRRCVARARCIIMKSWEKYSSPKDRRILSVMSSVFKAIKQ